MDNNEYSDDMEYLKKLFPNINDDIIEFKKDCPNYPYLPIILPKKNRIIAIGDIHGDYKLLLKLLKIAKENPNIKALKIEAKELWEQFKDQYDIEDEEYDDDLDDLYELLFKLDQIAENETTVSEFLDRADEELSKATPDN